MPPAVVAVSPVRMGLAAVLMVDFHWHYIPATLVCLLAGALIGGIQGYFVAFHRIPSFIVTLAGQLALSGLVLMTVKGLGTLSMRDPVIASSCSRVRR